MTKDVLPKADYSKYLGQWVVISNNKVIAHNKNLRNISGDIKKCRATPIIAKIPKEETLIF